MDLRLTELFRTKFVSGGSELTSGLDCQGLFVKLMQIYGNNVQTTDIASYATESVSRTICDVAATGKWEKIEQPVEGCALAIALDPMHPDKAQHLGVYIGEGKFMHILEKRGVVVTPITDRFFARKIRGFYKWIG